MNIEIDVANCVEALKLGKIICYPTDTVWGLGCDATNEVAVSKIFDLKKRVDAKSLVILVADENMLSKYVDVIPNAAIDIINQADKPITIIYDKVLGIAQKAKADDGSCGVRIASDQFCKLLIKKFNRPIISTSANLSGEETPRFFAEISSEIIKGSDYVVHFMRGDKTVKKPSSILKISNNSIVNIIRK